MPRTKSGTSTEDPDRPAGDSTTGSGVGVLVLWVAPLTCTAIFVSLLLRRSGNGIVFSRYSGQAALAILGFGAWSISMWWIRCSSSRRACLESTLRSLSLGRGVILALVLALPLASVYYAGGSYGALMLLPILLLAATLCMSTEHPQRSGALLVFSTLIVLVPCEALLLSVRNSPSIASVGPLRRLAHGLYGLDRNLIQYLPGATRFDPELGYSFVPGAEFTFRDTEFESLFRINSLGLRDDEDSLVAPEIVVLGDSFAMGWGVEHEESYGSLLEQRTGQKTINAGVSSYGTVRELKLLRRLDLSKARYLIIQYCDNDYRENRAFADRGNVLETMSKSTFLDAVSSHASFKRYLPFRFTWKTLALERRIEALANWIVPSPAYEAMLARVNPRVSAQMHAEMFLNALVHSPVRLDDLQLVVLELNPRGAQPSFLPALASAVSSEEYPRFIRDMRILDAASELGPDDWFVIDDHINARGHERVAVALERVLAQD